MVLILLDLLKELFGWKFPQVFAYFSTRMILAAITSLAVSIFLGPKFISKLYELKIGQPIRMQDCPLLNGKFLHETKKNTPTMGGLLILFSMLISMLLWMDLTHIFTLILFITTLILGTIGGIDDYLKLKHKNAKGLSAKKKLCIQALLSAILAAYLFVPSLTTSLHIGKWFAPPVVKENLRIENEPLTKKASETIMHQELSVKEYATRLYLPFFKGPIVKFEGIFVILAAIFIFFVVSGSSNAVNLTDGLDGLAAGCLIMVASCLAFISFLSNNVDLASYLNILYIEGSGEIGIYLSAFVGACLGFLWYNGHPAQVFMGDTGSLTLGGILGVSAVLLKKEILLALIGGIFVAEALSVILQVSSYRYFNRRRIFLCSPLHHHFEYKGWAENKVVIRFWIIGLLLAFIGLASLKFQ